MKIFVQMDHPKFIVCKNSMDNYQFDLITGEGRVLLKSRGWLNRQLCLKAIKSTQEIALSGHHYKRGVAEDGNYYILMGETGKPLGFSHMFTNPEDLEQNIRLVQKQAPAASLIDFT